MDIGKLDELRELEEIGATIELYAKNGDPLTYDDGGEEKPVMIEVVGSDSRRYRAAEDAETRRTINRRPGQKLSPEELLAGRIRLASSAVVGWSGFVKDGEPYECTRENVKALLRKAPFILRQVEEGVRLHGDFIAGQSSD